MNIQVNDIYYSSWGYDQTNITYYQVVRMTAKTAVFREIEGEIVHIGDDFSAKVIPILNKFNEHYPEELKKRIQNSSDGDIYFKMSSCQYAKKWDGKPKTETYTG